MSRPAGWAPTGTTTLAAVIGSPVRHSLSPVLFNAAFAAAGLDWVHVAFEVPAGSAGAALDAVRALGLGGLNVTMPHKADVAAAVDDLDPDAALLGAVNCVVPGPDGRLLGVNTDGEGFVRSLVEAGVDPTGADVALLGAGGAARAVAVALARAGAGTITVVNRSRDRADALVDLLDGVRPGVGATGGPDRVPSASLVVNATSLGMDGGAGSGTPAVAPDLLRPGQAVADLVYHPTVTPLLAAAAAAGAVPIGGVGMLLHQAAIAFERWTGVEAPVDAMRAAVEDRLG